MPRALQKPADCLECRRPLPSVRHVGMLRHPECRAEVEARRARARHSTRPSQRARTAPRGTSIAATRLTEAEIAGAVIGPHASLPATRGGCVGGARPCPFVSCQHHLYLDVNPSTGTLKLNFAHLEPDQLEETCSLDVADRGGVTLEAAGELLNLTRERVRQLETRALIKLQSKARGIL